MINDAHATRPTGHATQLLARLTEMALCAFVRLMTGARGQWIDSEPAATPRIYFANHASHGDALVLWTALPVESRRRARPVAAADYWLTNRLRRFVVKRVFRAVLIDRTRSTESEDPVELMIRAIDAGDSLILFPEGKRNATDDPLLPFKSGIYRLASARPGTELVPVWIDNLKRVMPRGKRLPLPILCTVKFGPAMRLAQDESKEGFLSRTEQALLGLAGSVEPNAQGTLR